MARWPTKRPFEEAREFARSLGLSGQKAWHEYCQSGNLPADIPSNPNKFYREEWQGYGDWLGTGNVSNQHKQFLSFAEAREVAHALHLPSAKAWYEYSALGNRPDNVPSAPDAFYGEEFTDWGDWLGTGTIPTQDREFLPFAEARAFAHTLGLRSAQAWERYCKSGEKPDNIPSSPRHEYPDVWQGWKDWLGKRKLKRRVEKYDYLNMATIKEVIIQ
jgi:hypothetical protein